VNFRLAKLYEKKGETSKAIEYYSKALAQWKHADENLPELIEAKTRLAKLRSK
jgi:tetratricopeptide (TPR) repeat protein